MPDLVPYGRRSQHLAKQLDANLRHALLNSRRDGRRRVHGILEEVFQVPTKVFLILRTEVEVKL
jgi:hypothetical protein